MSVKQVDNMLLFFHEDCPLSNWYRRTFIVKDITFFCVEQYLMYCKAMLFGDHEIGLKIMATQEPSEHKRLGRLVKNFNDDLWNQHKENYAFIGNLHKFRQNKEERGYLYDTRELELVEASPYDRIWGVGLGVDDPQIRYKVRWKGQNLHGITLMRVRDRLAQEGVLHG
jgi:ribA/ribD-fused uncharacterized protein